MKLSIKTILTTIALLCNAFAAYASYLPSREWVSTYSGSGYSYDMANKVAADKYGNVYVAGTTGGTSSTSWSDSNKDYLVIKYSPAGVKLWEARYNGPGNGADEATAIALDNNGNVYVTGYSLDEYGRWCFATIKYTSDGIRQWIQMDGWPRANFPTALFADNSGNVYVTGSAARRAQAEWSTSLSWTSGFDWLTIKYDTNGMVLWTRVYDAAQHGDDSALAIAVSVDAESNVYVVGHAGGGVYGDSLGTNLTIVKYNSDGTLQWSQTYNGGAQDIASAIALDPSGNIYVTGYSVGNGYDYITIKYTPDGIQQWVKRYNGTENGDDFANQIVLDPGGNIYVTGYSKGSGTDYDITTIQYNAEGVEQWVARFNGDGNSIDMPTQAVIDSMGHLYITGYSVGSGTGYDMVTIRYSSNGAEEWMERYNGSGNSNDFAYGMAVDNNDNIYVVGGAFRSDKNFEHISIKYGVPFHYRLKDVRVIDTISNGDIELDSASFSKTPYSITTTTDKTVIEWRFDTFFADSVEDLTFDIILKNTASGEQRLVSHKFELLYTDINGNPVITELGAQYVNVLNSAFEGTISTNKLSYEAGEDVVVTPIITNLSEYGRTIDAKVLIEDKQGNLVKEITALSNLYFAQVEAKGLGPLTFNTASNFAEEYKAHLILYENQNQIADATASFKVQPNMILTSKVTTDKTAYNSNEQATISSVVNSASPNYIFEELTVNIAVSNQQSAVYTETKNIASLMSGATLTFKNYWNIGTNPPGVYPVTLEVKDITGTVISSSSQTITINDSVMPKTALKGQISVDKQSLLAGEPAMASYSVTNVGNIDLQGVTFSVQTAHVVTQAVYDTLTSESALLLGGSYSSTGQIDTTKYTAKDYLVILKANIGGIEETIAGTYFRVEGSPTVPSLAAPINGADVPTFTPALSVNNASDPNDDKITYEFELYADGGLTQPVAASDTVTEGTGITSWTVPVSLSENQTYYWRSRAYDGKLFGPWMTPVSFRVNTVNDLPTAPTVSSPADGMAVPSTTPVLVVNNASDPDSSSLTYNFDLALDANFLQIVSSTSGVSSGQETTSWQTPTIQENIWYYWRAQADDWLDMGPWSTTSKFFVNMVNDAPFVPVIIAPADNSTIAVLSADIVVNNSTDPDSAVISYLFETDTTSTFDSPNIIRSGSVAGGQGTTAWNVSGLKDNTQYYVRAKASDGTAESPWSAVVGFFVNTVNDAPTVPILANPSNGAGVITATSTLSVHNSSDPDRDVLTYDFEVYGDAGLSTLVASVASMPETTQVTSWTVPVALAENATYYWRARAFDGALSSPWMPAASFMVNTANDAPGAPKLSSPADGSSVATLTPALAVINAVDPDSGRLTYDFEVYSNGVLTASITGVPEGVSGISSAIVAGPLMDNTLYQWRARAFDGDHYGPWMAMATFTVHIGGTSINATIDFDPDSLNKTSKGTWAVTYIELPAGYNPADIDISSIRFEGIIPAETRPYAIGDHDKDGVSDLMVKFKRSEVIEILPNGELVPVHVSGKVGSAMFEGVDIIKVMP